MAPEVNAPRVPHAGSRSHGARFRCWVVLVRFLRERRCADGFCASQARRRAVRHGRRADDGEPVVRPHARVAAGRERPAAGLIYVDKDGVAHETWPLAPDFQGCALRGSGPHLAEGSRRSTPTALRRLPEDRQGRRPISHRLLRRGRPARSSARSPRATRRSTTTSAR